MKTSFKPILVCLFLLVGYVVSVSAFSQMFGPSVPEGSRSWRLEEQTVRIDTTGTWQDFSKNTNYYNAVYQTVLDSTVWSYYSTQTGWEAGNVDWYRYDITGQYVTEIISNVTIFGGRIPLIRGLFTYNNSNALIFAKIQNIGIDRNWHDVQRLTINYLGNGTLYQMVGWDVGEDRNNPGYKKWDFTFDDQGRIATQTEYTSEDSTNWTQGFQTTYLYDPDDATNGQSLVNQIARYMPMNLFYDKPTQIGQILQQTKQIWLFSHWRYDTRDTYTYSHSGARNSRAMTYHQQCTFNMLGEWENCLQNSYDYDYFGNLSTDLCQKWNLTSSIWENYIQTSNVWSPQTANDDETSPAVNELSISLYPNPCRENVNVSILSKSKAPVKLEMFNSKGQKVHQEWVNPAAERSMPASMLSKYMQSSGVYFLKATQGAITTKRKLIKLN